MNANTTLEEFLRDNRIEADVWAAANIPWDLLKAVGEDYLTRQAELGEVADLCSRVMQKLPKVHSVRWRVKDADHLLEKIVRKRAAGDGESKYLTIGVDNYHEIVTDLVGLRALHLFKDECFEIDAALRGAFVLAQGEDPVAYIREGDPPELLARFVEAGLKVKPHNAGYRSVHYVVVSQPLQRRVAAEIQVRTIFEEGWSEIDHKVRYPNFSEDPQIGYFLRIFNGLAGSADEMGSFVRGLVKVLEANQQKLADASDNYEQTLQKLEATVAELDVVRKSSESSDATVSKLKREIADLRAASERAASARAYPVGGLTRTEAGLWVRGNGSLGLGDSVKGFGLGLANPFKELEVGIKDPLRGIGLGFQEPVQGFGLGIKDPLAGVGRDLRNSIGGLVSSKNARQSKPSGDGGGAPPGPSESSRAEAASSGSTDADESPSDNS